MKKISRYFLFVFLSLALNVSLMAQQGDSKREKIDALRAEFISKKVNFTSSEASVFWPLYNEMNDKIEAVRKSFRAKYNAKTNYNFETDKEAEEYLNAEVLLKQREYELYKEYNEKFKKILPVKKVVLLRRAEEDFRKEILKAL